MKFSSLRSGVVAALGLASAATLAQGVTIVNFAFDGETAAPTTTAPGVTATNVTVRDGTVITFPAGNAPTAVDSISTNTFNDADGNAFLFSLTVDSGQQLDLTSIEFDEQRSSTGPPAFNILVNGASVGGGTVDTAFEPNPDNVTPIGLMNLTGTVNFAIVGTGATSAAGTFRIDNLRVEGAVEAIPEPTALGLLGLGGLGLLRRRRAR